MSWYLEWIGCGFGVFGALLLATNTRLSGWGFIAFLVSNCCWIGHGLLQDKPSLIYMQAVMTFTSLLGAYRWLYKKTPADTLEPELATVDTLMHFRARKEA
jgi:drug/metabolite transporter (DMT)-like permease